MTESQSSDARIDAIIADYLKAVAAGSAPDRALLLTQHADLADELRSFFADHDRMNRFVEPATIGPESVVSPTLGNVRYFGDYELMEEIARGGMGVVYKARQLSLNRVVALKMILAGQLASDGEVRRFRAEAEAAASLDHPNIVPIFEVGEHQGQQYFAMGFVEGGNLSDRLKDGPLPPREAAAMIRTLSEAVQYAHDCGIVHRDLKPANVVMAGSVPKITDFGLAKRAKEAAGPTVTGDILGTPAYMPPEQATGNPALVGPLADVYGLGAVLYALLTGRAPFQAESAIETIRQVIEDEPVQPRKLRPDIPRDLENVCLKCLDKRAERRYGSAQLLAQDLVRFLDSEPVIARRRSVLRRTIVWVRKRPWAIATIISLGLLTVSCLAYGLRAEMRYQRWEALYYKAQAQRLVLAGHSENMEPESISDLLRQAAVIRSDSRLHDEAVALVEATRLRRNQNVDAARQALDLEQIISNPEYETSTLHESRGLRLHYLIFRIALGWPTVIGVVSLVLVSVTVRLASKRQRVAPAFVVRFGAVGGGIAVVWALWRFLAVLDVADLSATQILVSLLMLYVPLASGGIAVLIGIGLTNAAARGYYRPAMFIQTTPQVDIDWGARLANPTLKWVTICWMLSVAIDVIDGNIRTFSVVGTTVLLTFLIFVSICVLMVGVFLLVMARPVIFRCVRIREGPQPAIALAGWLLAAAASATFLAIQLSERVITWNWQNVPIVQFGGSTVYRNGSQSPDFDHNSAVTIAFAFLTLLFGLRGINRNLSVLWQSGKNRHIATVEPVERPFVNPRT